MDAELPSDRLLHCGIEKVSVGVVKGFNFELFKNRRQFRVDRFRKYRYHRIDDRISYDQF